MTYRPLLLVLAGCVASGPVSEDSDKIFQGSLESAAEDPALTAAISSVVWVMAPGTTRCTAVAVGRRLLLTSKLCGMVSYRQIGWQPASLRFGQGEDARLEVNAVKVFYRREGGWKDSFAAIVLDRDLPPSVTIAPIASEIATGTQTALAVGYGERDLDGVMGARNWSRVEAEFLDNGDVSLGDQPVFCFGDFGAPLFIRQGDYWAVAALALDDPTRNTSELCSTIGIGAARFDIGYAVPLLYEARAESTLGRAGVCRDDSDWACEFYTYGPDNGKLLQIFGYGPTNMWRCQGGQIERKSCPDESACWSGILGLDHGCDWVNW